MPRPKRSILSALSATIVAATASFLPFDAHARARGDDHTIAVNVGGSQTLRIGGPVERVIVGDPAVLDVVSLGGTLLLSAKAAGETELTVYSRSAGATSYHVIAEAPIAALQAALKEAFPGEDNLSVHAAGGAVYMSGTVSDAATIEAATRLANSLMLSGGRKVADVINLTTVTASQQVQVQLRFVEVSRTSLKQLGFNAFMQGYNNQGVPNQAGALLGTNDPRNYYDPSQNFNGPQAGNANYSTMPILLSPVQGAFALSYSMSRWAPLSATLSLLEGRGVAKTLSEPTLVANSGERAHFIVGGEFPIPVPDPLGRVIIQYKPYGAQLTFTPTVVGQDTVHLELDAIVSAIDRQNATAIGTSTVPGISTRESSTSVRMRDGQSFAIAGLLQDTISAQDKRVPLLGDLPLIGMLFRNTNYQREQEELVVLVSTRMVKPMDPGEVPPLTTEDEFNDPQDWALFLLGSLEKTKTRSEHFGEAKALPAGAPKRAPPVAPTRSQAGASGAMGFSR